MLIEAHWLLGKVKRYYKPLRKTYEIIKVEYKNMAPQAVLQAAVKAVNDTAGPNGFIPTLLVFGAIPGITERSTLSKNQLQRAKTVN